MIQWGTGANKIEVDCLTRRNELQVELQLAKRRSQGLPETVLLDEPTALEFAILRKAALAADAEVAEQFLRPADEPEDIPGESAMEKVTRFADYRQALSDWLDARHNYRTDPDTAVYANVIVEAVKTLTEYTITIADLRPECFKVTPVQALLEVWETPLGGPVSPVATTPTWAIPGTPAPTEPDVAPSNVPSDVPPSPDSPESTRSSDPGTKPSPPSPPPSSTA